MDLRDMTALIKAYDAKEKVQESIRTILGNPRMGFDSPLSDLDGIASVIAHQSPLYDPKQDFYDQEFGRILDDKNITAEERAGRLLQIQ